MPTRIRTVTIGEVQAHEVATNANVRLGSYEMDRHLDIGDIECFHLELVDEDIDRLFLLWEPTFFPHTNNRTCKLVDLLPTAESMAMSRRPKGEKNLVDLALGSELEPVLVGDSLTGGPLVAIDGNHRLTAHYIRHKRVGGIKMFVGIHERMFDWHFIPPAARRAKK